MKTQSERIRALAGIKLLHAAIWLFFAGCIVAIPLAGARLQFHLAAILTVLVLVECAVLAMNKGRDLPSALNLKTPARPTVTGNLMS